MSELNEIDNNVEAYKTLLNCTLALLILFNRRRIGDVQYLKLNDYSADRRSNVKDFENVLSQTDKILTTQYKRVINTGKGSRGVVILFPRILQKFMDLLYRPKYIPPENEYVFAIPGSSLQWCKGDVAIKALTKRIKLQHPETITSNKLRKHSNRHANTELI